MIIPPGFCAVFAQYSSGGGIHEAQNVQGYEVNAPLTQADVNQISVALAVPYKAVLNSGSQWHGVKVLEGNDGPPTEWLSTSSAGAGGQSGALCPPMVQGLIRKQTGLAGRKFRGRMFIPDCQEGHTGDTGVLDGTWIGKLNDIAGAWSAMTATVTSGHLGNLVILHSDPTDPTALTVIEAESKVATLRRRFPR